MSPRRRRGLLRGNSLSLAFLVAFLVALVGQAIAGHRLYNDEQREHAQPTVSLVEFVTSSRFGVEAAENWQSEFLQFALYIVATIWLVQRGSAESKPPGEEGGGTDEQQLLGRHARSDSPLWARVGGLRTVVYANSLAIVFATLFLASWLAQSLTGWRDFNDDQTTHGEPEVSWLGYLGRPDFWDRTFQNWQSEFLQFALYIVATIWLVQRGSAESKPPGEEGGGTDEQQLLGRHARSDSPLGVPGRGHDGDLHGLHAPAGLARVEAGGGAPSPDDEHRLTGPRIARRHNISSGALTEAGAGPSGPADSVATSASASRGGIIRIDPPPQPIVREPSPAPRPAGPPAGVATPPPRPSSPPSSWPDEDYRGWSGL